MVKTDREPRRIPDAVGYTIISIGGATAFGGLIDIGIVTSEIQQEAIRKIPPVTRLVSDISLQRGTEVILFEGTNIVQMGEVQITFPDVMQQRTAYQNERVAQESRIDLSQGVFGRIPRDIGIFLAGAGGIFLPVLANWLLGRKQRPSLQAPTVAA